MSVSAVIRICYVVFVDQWPVVVIVVVPCLSRVTLTVGSRYQQLDRETSITEVLG